MAKQTTDPEALLGEAYRIAEDEGLNSLSIRKVASACDVSVGTVYTYFPSKGDLVAAVIDRFFQSAFQKDFCVPGHHEGYVDFCRRLAQRIDETLQEFRSDWLVQIESLPSSEREASRVREAQVMQHMTEQLSHVLLDDPAVTVDFGGQAGAEKLSTFVLDVVSVPRHAQNRETLFSLLESALYNKKLEL